MTLPKTEDRTPSALLPYQQRWCADNSPVKLCEKSRRIGLSWGEAADTALLAASSGGMDAWYIGYNKDMALEFIRDCANWAKFYGLAAGEIEETEEVFVEGDDKKSVLAFVIRFASGWRVTALSSRPSNLRGKQGRVIIDEAAFHEQLGELLKAAMALLMWGGQVHIISTHDGVDNPFNELITDIRAGKKPYSIHRITFDEAVSDGLYRRICLRLGKEWTPQGEAAWCKEIRDFYGEDASEELEAQRPRLARRQIQQRNCVMANLTETNRWEAGIYQLETSDPVMGGPNGIDNRAPRELANRTLWLKTELAKAVAQIGALNDGTQAYALKTGQITAGAGLTGGGTLAANRTISLGQPADLTETSESVAVSNTHSHKLPRASSTARGIVRVANTLTGTATDDALSAAMGKKLADEKLGNSGDQTITDGTLTVGRANTWNKIIMPSGRGNWIFEANPTASDLTLSSKSPAKKQKFCASTRWARQAKRWPTKAGWPQKPPKRQREKQTPKN